MRQEKVLITSDMLQTASTVEQLRKAHFADYKFGYAVYKIKNSIFRTHKYEPLSPKAKHEMVVKRIRSHINGLVRKLNKQLMLSPKLNRYLVNVLRSQVKLTISIEDIDWCKNNQNPNITSGNI